MRRVASWVSLAALSLGLMVSAVLFSAGTATASTCGGYGQPACPSTATITTTDPQPLPQPAPTATAASATTGSLAFTGADVVGTVVVGGALIGAGVLVVAASRRRRSA